MENKKKQKPRGMKYKIREEKKREQRIGLAVTVAILIVIISASGFFIHSMLTSSPERQEKSSTLEPKAAIVDQLSLTMPNQTFIQAATNTLKRAGYTVDYYNGEKVTVEFYGNLPTRDYRFIILRMHSTAAELQDEEYIETPVCLFTSQPYSTKTYLYEQLTDQIVMVSYTMPEPPYYFGIMPEFVASRMKGSFQSSIIIMMGCEGLNNTRMAEAFIEKGAKVYISWNGSVSASHTDQATTQLLKHLLTQKQTIKQAVTETMNDVGPDPVLNSILQYYPIEAENVLFQTPDDV